MKRSKTVEKEVAEAAAETAKVTKKSKLSDAAPVAEATKPKAKKVAKKKAPAVEPVTEVTAETPASKAEKVAKPAKKAAKKAAPQVRHPEIFKKSVASVIRALAVVGVESAVIVKAIQSRVPEAKLSGIQSSIYEGKKGIFKPALLTEKQIETLTAEGATA
jgi:hypothetical protein